MGLTLIAFGASIPDCFSSLIVAKLGHGDMAVSNAIGSNVFDILICLGLPWFIGCLSMNKTSVIHVKSRGNYKNIL
jgi:Ca2+/Na+ antiporter